MPKSKRSKKSKARAAHRRKTRKKGSSFKKLKQLGPAYVGLALSQMPKNNQQ